MERRSRMGSKLMLLFVAVLSLATVAQAQHKPPAPTVTDYLVGAQDVLTITSYDQADLSGKFTIEADGTFTYPMIGRVKAGGTTLRQVEMRVKQQMKDMGFFKNPQITVSIDAYRSQKVFIVGEVRNPGSYSLSGDTSLVEALARAGSTLPTASGEAVIVHPAGGVAPGPVLPTSKNAGNVEHVDLKELQGGLSAQNDALRDGDTIYVPRAESVYVFGQVKSPGAYVLQQRDTSVLQVLALAGGITDRGSTGRIKIARIVNGEKQELRVKLGDIVQPGDTVIVEERFF